MMIFGKHLFRNVLFICLMLALLPSKSFEIEISDHSLTLIGETHLAAGRYIIAKQFFLGVLPFTQYINDKALIRICYMRLGDAYWNLGQMDLSIVNYKKASMISRLFNLMNENKEADVALEIHGLYSKAKDLRDNKQYQASIELFDKAILSARSCGWSNHEVKCLRQKSIALYEMSDYTGYYLCNLEASQLAQQANNSREICLCNNNLGIYYYKKQNYDKALDRYYYVYDLAQKENYSNVINEVLSNISIIMFETGKYRDADICMREILKKDKAVKNSDSIIIDLNNIGIINRKMGDKYKDLKFFYTALNAFHEAFSLIEDSRNRNQYIIMSNIGDVYKSLNNYDYAIRRYKAALRLALINNDKEMICIINNNIGNVYIKINHNIEAFKYYNKALDISTTFKLEYLNWESYYGLAMCNERKGDYDVAIKYYSEALDIIEQKIEGISNDLNKIGYIVDKDEVYDGLIRSCYHRDILNNKVAKFEMLLDSIERKKERILYEYLLGNESLPRVNQNELERINIRILDIQNKIYSNNPQSNKTRELENIFIWEEENYLRLSGSTNRNLKNKTNIFNIIDEVINSNTAILEYHLGKLESYLIIITKDSIHIQYLPSREYIEKSVIGYIKHISAAPENSMEIERASKKITKMLIPNIIEISPKKINNIIIIPDGILCSIPFETFIYDSEDKKLFFIQKYSISYCPSIAILQYFKNHKYNNMGYFGIGNPIISVIRNGINNKKINMENTNEVNIFESIPYSSNEIVNASKYFGVNNRSIFLGEEAKEIEVKKLSEKQYEVIHIASHSIIDELYPQRSAILLAKTKNEDGYLYLREIYNININAELVILSACQTARGVYWENEGIIGLARVFIYAGARSVMATQWKVIDKASSILIKYYFEQLKKGKSKVEALKNAKNQMLLTKYRHPYYWAGYILIGEPNNIIKF